MGVAENGAEQSADRPESEWDAYSDYQLVSKWVTSSIRDAIEAYALLDQGGMTGYKVDAREEAQLRADVLAAAVRLRIELESERKRGEEYAEEILDRWEGEEGFIKRFRNAPSQQTGQLEFFEGFVSDIRRAGWELGYLKAGREESGDGTGDPYDGEVRDLMEEMTR